MTSNIPVVNATIVGQETNDQYSLPQANATIVGQQYADLPPSYDGSAIDNGFQQQNLNLTSNPSMSLGTYPSAPPKSDFYSQGPPPPYMSSNGTSLTINSSKLKDLVGKSYAQTLLYLTLTKQIILEQIKNNSNDKTLLELQTKINTAIASMQLSKDESAQLQVTPISEDTSVSIAEILLEIAGLGLAVTAGGKKRSRGKSKRKRGNSKRRRTRRHRN